MAITWHYAKYKGKGQQTARMDILAELHVGWIDRYQKRRQKLTESADADLVKTRLPLAAIAGANR